MPSLSRKLTAREGSAYSATGAVRSHAKTFLCTTTLLGHTRVLEVEAEVLKGAQRSQGAEGVEKDEVLLNANLKVGGLGLSIIDESRAELLYSHLSQLSVTLTATADVHKLQVKVEKCQVDYRSILIL